MEKKNKAKSKNIYLTNRDNNTTWLEPFTENLSLLKQKYELATSAVAAKNNDKHYTSVDPSGGPMLSVGDSIGKRKITDIVKYDHMYNFMVELK